MHRLAKRAWDYTDQRYNEGHKVTWFTWLWRDEWH